MMTATTETLLENPSAENPDKLAIFRARVQEETKAHGKMSDAAVAKLRSQAEEERIRAIGLERFRNALRSVITTPENLEKLIRRCIYAGPAEKNLDRRVHKLQWWLTAGFLLGREIDSPSMILFFSNLTPDEASMTDAQFQKAWDMKSAQKRKQCRIEQGLVSDTKPERLCKSGPKCMRAYRRKAAPAKGNGEYCSTACAASDRARAKRALLAGPAASEMTQ
jgi:hypothetical protein